MKMPLSWPSSKKEQREINIIENYIIKYKNHQICIKIELKMKVSKKNMVWQ